MLFRFTRALFRLTTVTFFSFPHTHFFAALARDVASVPNRCNMVSALWDLTVHSSLHYCVPKILDTKNVKLGKETRT